MSDSRKKEEMRSGPVPTPEYDALTVWAGYGSGESCAYCCQPIAAGEIEYEVFDRAHLASGRCLRFHIACHALWCALQAPR